MVSHSCGSPLSSNTGSESALQFLDRKLVECRASHIQCGAQAVNTVYLPTRLTDVGEPGNENICLRERQRLLKVAYVALSHCWGRLPMITLNAGSEPLLRSGFKIKALPQTFQDAIVVCRRSNIRYLWIDSL
jgi:hypothetical protein